MTDFARDPATDSVAAREDEDRLPWLEPADEDDFDEGISPGKLAALIVAALIALGIVIAGVWLLRQKNAPPAKDPTLIAAPEGDYKVRPDAPGGMRVEGKGDSAFATSEGAEAVGKIDPNARVEAPVKPVKAAVAPVAPPKPVATANIAVPKPAGSLQAKPPVAASGGSGTQMVQLGAFGSEAKAKAAGAALVKRFAFLGGMAQQIVSADVGGSTVYRLRAAAGGQAADACTKLRAAGENCMMVR